MKRAFSGIQPSGDVTLGNYLGALKNWVSLQDTYECLFCIVDLHALTQTQNPYILNKRTQDMAAILMACGVDPHKSQLFVQSQVSGHAELAWILNCLTPLGWLNRMTQFKDKAQKSQEKACLGLFAYPVLMAADILCYQATHVPVGEDQKQHLELTRQIAQTFNRFVGSDYFILPEPLIQGSVSRIMSLRDGTKKMSKSDPSDYSRLSLLDDEDTLKAKIQKAKTDNYPLPETSAELENRYEAKNLIKIYSALSEKTVEEVLSEFSGMNFSHFKPRFAELIIHYLKPIRLRALQYLKYPDEVNQVLKQSQEKAQNLSQKVLKEVKNLIGLLK